MSLPNQSIWMTKGAGCLNDGEMAYDPSSRIEPKRSHQWFMDGTPETDLFPNKKQAIVVPTPSLFSGLLNSNVSPWGNASGFHSISGQFAERLFDTETAGAVNFDDRSLPSVNTEKVLLERKVNEDLFTNDSSFGLSMSRTLEDPRYGLHLGGIRKVKVSEVKDSENIVCASMGYVFNSVDNNSMSTNHAYKVEDGIMPTGLPYYRGDSIGDTYKRESSSVFMSMGQSYNKSEENNAISMSSAFDKGDNNFMSMGQTYNTTDDSSITVGQTYSKGDDSAISISQNYHKGDNYNLSIGPSYSRGESTIISFGGGDDDDTNPSGSIMSLLMGQPCVQRTNAASEKELVQSNGYIASGAEVSRKKDEPKTSKKVSSNNFPSNVRSLLSTGILDGVPVKYIARSQEKELRAVIKSSGYQCGCQTCNYSKVINAYEFERHAGCKTKHPNNHIYFENRKTIYGIVQELRSTPQNMLFDVIQTITGSPINQKCFRLWKDSFLAATVELQRIYGKDEMKPLS